MPQHHKSKLSKHGEEIYSIENMVKRHFHREMMFRYVYYREGEDCFEITFKVYALSKWKCKRAARKMCRNLLKQDFYFFIDRY